MTKPDTFVAIDIETTGLNNGRDKITEVALVKYENGKITDTYTTLVNPGIKIPERIIDITGINNEMTNNSPYIDEILEEILKFTKGYILAGHGILFDYGFLKRAMTNNNHLFQCYGIDTLKIARKLLPELEKKNLQYLCGYYGISDNNHHRALNDAMAAGELLLILEEKYYDTNKEAFAPYELIYKVKKQSPATESQLKKIRELMERYRITIDFDMEHLTKNEASRKIDKIMSVYGIVRSE